MGSKSFSVRRAWIVILILVAVFIALGPVLDSKSSLVVLLYKIGIISLPSSAFLFILVYTILGFRGRAKWWMNDIGMSIVMPYFALVTSNCVLAWTELFHRGLLDTPLPVWIDISSLYGATLLLGWRSYVWLKVSREERLMLLERLAEAERAQMEDSG
jgi:hypothetical protein